MPNCRNAPAVCIKGVPSEGQHPRKDSEPGHTGNAPTTHPAPNHARPGADPTGTGRNPPKAAEITPGNRESVAAPILRGGRTISKSVK